MTANEGPQTRPHNAALDEAQIPFRPFSPFQKNIRRRQDRAVEQDARMMAGGTANQKLKTVFFFPLHHCPPLPPTPFTLQATKMA